MLNEKAVEVLFDVSSLRSEFPGVKEYRYFDVAARGLLPLSARRAVDIDLDARLLSGGNKAEMFRTVESARERFARLIGADADEIAITKNVSEGLNIVAAGYPWKPGDNVVLCAELEHPNNVYPWLLMARTHGISVKFVKSVDGRFPVEAVFEAMDESTRIVTASTVSFSPGMRADLDAIGGVCQERDVLFLADAAQSAGILRLDVSRTPVGAVAFSTQKGLLGLYGMGLLYCRRLWAERLVPSYLARFGVDLGDSHEADLGSLDFQFMPGARRFDLGNYNFPAAAVLNESLKLLQSIGPDVVENHVMSLSRRFVEKMHEKGFAVAGYPIQADLANIVTIYDEGICKGRLHSLSDHLTKKHVKFSERKGSLRLSIHVYNNNDDVDEVLEEVSVWMK